MELFWKAAAVMILTVILGSAIGKTEKDLSAILSILACCILMTTAVHYLSEVFGFFRELGFLGQGQNTGIQTLLNISGVALISEITGMIGADSGNQSLGKAMLILGNAVILFLALTVFESFLSVVQEIMGYL